MSDNAAGVLTLHRAVDAMRGLYGLLQLFAHRPEIAQHMGEWETNHRAEEARLVMALEEAPGAAEVEVIDPYVMDLVREHGSTMTNSEIVQRFLPKESLARSARSESGDTEARRLARCYLDQERGRGEDEETYEHLAQKLAREVLK
jgi:ribonuclease HI